MEAWSYRLFFCKFRRSIVFIIREHLRKIVLYSGFEIACNAMVWNYDVMILDLLPMITDE
jgi:hypothetical protein